MKDIENIRGVGNNAIVETIVSTWYRVGMTEFFPKIGTLSLPKVEAQRKQNKSNRKTFLGVQPCIDME